MLNIMAVVKLTKCTFDEWNELQKDEDMDSLWCRDVKVAKVDDHTAIVCMEVFDRHLMETLFSDPAMKEATETYGIEHTFYELKPASTP